VDEREDLALLPLYLDSDRLAHEKKSGVLVDALEGLKKEGSIVDYLFSHEHSLGHATVHTIGLYLVLPVAKQWVVAY
jgi:hypothetical protein